ncbi:unnamed protein product, partial [Amoebophrya sp. A25]|eukprot:GSA25T00024985001.1
MVRKCPGKAAVIGTTMYVSTADSRQRAPNPASRDEGNADEDTNAFLEVDREFLAEENRMHVGKASKNPDAESQREAEAVKVDPIVAMLDDLIEERKNAYGQEHGEARIWKALLWSVNDRQHTDSEWAILKRDVAYLLVVMDVDFLKGTMDDLAREAG